MLDICVPSWNSLEYLKILHKGVNRNTKLRHTFRVHDNGSTDGTLEWLRENNIFHTHSPENLGFAGVNHAIAAGNNPYVFIANSDMYLLPNWDVELFKQIKKFESQNIDKFTISCSLIEPVGNNPEYVISYHGHDANTFDEEGLLNDYISNRSTKYTQENTCQYSHPILIPRKMLEPDLLDVKYFPGFGIDHDIPAQAYQRGCRNFIMLTSSRAYHFVSKTFTKLPPDVKNRHGEDVFENKWRLSVKDFRSALNIAGPFAEVKDGIL